MSALDKIPIHLGVTLPTGLRNILEKDTAFFVRGSKNPFMCLPFLRSRGIATVTIIAGNSSFIVHRSFPLEEIIE